MSLNNLNSSQRKEIDTPFVVHAFATVITILAGIITWYFAEVYARLGFETFLGVLSIAISLFCYLNLRTEESSVGFYISFIPLGGLMAAFSARGWMMLFFGAPYGTLTFLSVMSLFGIWMSFIAKKKEDLFLEAMAKIAICILIGSGVGACVSTWTETGLSLPAGAITVLILVIVAGGQIYLRERK